MAAGVLSGDLESRGGTAAWVRERPVFVALVAIGILLLTLVLGVGLGVVRVGPFETVGVVLWKTFGIDVGVARTPAAEAIVWELRLPRVLTAMVVGSGLAVAGAT